MKRKLLSMTALALTAALSAPLVQADRGDRGADRDSYREVRVQRVERYYYRDDNDYRHDRGAHRGWYKDKHHGGRDDYYPEPRGYREYYPQRSAYSPVPILAGGVIGGVVGHELGRGNPGDTAVGAVIGTIIGYEIVRNR